MEKISALIDKLQELKNSNAGLQSISYYVQLLQAEVLHARNQQREQEQQAQRHVAVIMPATTLATEPAAANGYTNIPQHHHTNNNTANTVTPAPAHTPSSRPAPIPSVPVPPAERPAEKPAEKEKKIAAPTLFEPAPPATPQKNGNQPDSNGLRKELKELNELVAQSGPSLNDRLRQSQVELADRLSDIPVKDLRQAIGINDKFQFIQELFRGDVDMYERSVKTINELHSLQEAEYWIERELKIRQGWEENNSTVRQFYAMVRKRFS